LPCENLLHRENPVLALYGIAVKCCGFGSCGFLQDLKKNTSQGPGVYETRHLAISTRRFQIN
jgi:hypothetical protein